MTDGAGPPARGRVNTLARRLLVAWTILFLVVACGPAIIGGAFGSASGAAFGGGISFAVTIALFVPWLAGAAILCLVVLVTR